MHHKAIVQRWKHESVIMIIPWYDGDVIARWWKLACEIVKKRK